MIFCGMNMISRSNSAILETFLPIFPLVTAPQEVERLVSALAEIRRRFQTDGSGLLSQEYIDPQVVTSPQEAFYADKCSLPLRETEGKVCSEFVMCYPPGIPILAPGERITAEILDYIEYAKAKGCNMTGPEDPDILRLNVLAGR